MSFWEGLAGNLIIQIVVSSIVAVLSAIVRTIWAHIDGGNAQSPQAWQGLDWTEWSFVVLMVMALNGAALMSVGMIARLFALTGSVPWPVGPLVLSWIAYLAVSFVLSWIGYQMFLTYQTAGRPVSADFRSTRLRRITACQFSKLAATVFLFQRHGGIL